MSRLAEITLDIEDFVAGLIANAILAFFAAWMVMLMLGAAHSHDEIVPNLSYWGSFWVALAVKVATNAQVDRDD